MRRLRGEADQSPGVPQERIRVPHEEDRGVALTDERRALRDAPLEGRSVSERDLAGALDRGTVRERIAERHAELDHISAPVQRGARQHTRRAWLRIADGEVHVSAPQRERFRSRSILAAPVSSATLIG